VYLPLSLSLFYSFVFLCFLLPHSTTLFPAPAHPPRSFFSASLPQFDRGGEHCSDPLSLPGVLLARESLSLAFPLIQVVALVPLARGTNQFPFPSYSPCTSTAECISAIFHRHPVKTFLGYFPQLTFRLLFFSPPPTRFNLGNLPLVCRLMSLFGPK